MAEAIFRRHPAEKSLEVSVASAGFLERGRRSPRNATLAIKRLGGDLTAHESRNVRELLTSPPELLLTMTRQHLRLLAEIDRELLPRSFTFKEFVRLGEVEGARREGEALSNYVRRVGAGRRPPVLFGASEEDIADPMGKRMSAYTRCARELEELVQRLIRLINAGPLEK